MKLFHKSLIACITAGYAASSPVSAGEERPAGKTEATPAPAFAAPFDPAKGFRPSQANLTEIFLQIAGSLEATGSPEGYMRHIQAEHARIAAAWEKKFGKPLVSRMPAHLNDEQIEKILRNWKVLAAPLQLEAFAREIERFAREGIAGTRLSGTVAVQYFNEHQDAVFNAMENEGTRVPGFSGLSARLIKELEFDKETVSLRGYETSRRDAVSYALVMKNAFLKKFESVDKIAKPDKAAQIKSALHDWFLDLGYLAQTELELGILESAMKRL